MNSPLRLLVWALLFAAQAGFGAGAATASPGAAPGVYFSKKTYQPAPLPRFAEVRDRLPSPIFEERPEWVSMYWKSWELAFKNFHEPAPGSGYVSQFIDAAFNENIFLWDTCFMTLFCNCAHPLVPGIASLDNFYAKQHEDGEICREINRSTGRDYAPWVDREGRQLFSRWGWTGVGNEPVVYQGRPTPQPPPELTLDALNHPVLAWAELESYRVTGDRERLGRVYEPLVRYYRALQKYLRQGNGLYMTDWASMDNSPRNAFLKGGGCAIGPILYLLEFAVGLKPDAASNTLVWEVASAKPLGVERYRFNRHVVSLKAEPSGGDVRSLKLSVASDGPFKLVVRHGGREETYPIAKGQSSFRFGG